MQHSQIKSKIKREEVCCEKLLLSELKFARGGRNKPRLGAGIVYSGYSRGFGESAERKLFTRATKMKVYFAHPASPWERGSNENTNGLIRQFFPKGTDFNKVTRKEIKHAQDLLKGRPRKVLDWETPYDAFKKLMGVALET